MPLQPEKLGNDRMSSVALEQQDTQARPHILIDGEP
jgi:hypothetical protein